MLHQRGRCWFQQLCATHLPVSPDSPSLLVADTSLAGWPARYITVVPDRHNPFPRARSGEVGLREGWALASAVQDAMQADQAQDKKRAIIAIIDTPGQAYGRREEAFGIHQALAAAAGAYARARLAGHPVIGLIVGKAMSGAFLAHGYQANRLLALDDSGVMVHAMGKEAAARITLRTVAELEALAASIPPMAYDIGSYASLGLLWRLLPVRNADQPLPEDVQMVRATLEEALLDIQASMDCSLVQRLQGPHRQASRRVRTLLREQWPD